MTPLLYAVTWISFAFAWIGERSFMTTASMGQIIEAMTADFQIEGV